jgi:hypothetical protein
VADDHQHYVPQLLLRNFASGGKRNKQIWVFDKREGKSFRTAIRNVGSENWFYDYSLGSAKHSLDPALQKLEDVVAPDILDVVRRRAFPLDDEARVRIAFFVAVQMVRTNAHRQQSVDLFKQLGEEVERRGGWAEGANPFLELSTEDLGAQSIRMIPGLAKSAAPLLLSKSWILYATRPQVPYFIGDHPVTLDNNVVGGDVIGSLGLASPGIEVYLPVSDTLSMGFLCPSNEDMIRNAFRLSERVMPNSLNTDAARRMVRALDGEEPYLFTPDNVARHNSLQVSYAERFVFSRNDDFSLAMEMIAATPEVRTGPRFTVA